MDGWDQETLERAIAQKHGAEAGKPNKTKIICKHFLDAVEKRVYGWFWKCPNGESCIYRHALPPGYILKSEMSQMLADEKANQVRYAGSEMYRMLVNRPNRCSRRRVRARPGARAREECM